MNWTDAAPIVGYMLGAFALGWGCGFIYLTFRKIADSVG